MGPFDCVGEYIGISAGGFSDKLAVLTETMLDKLMRLDIDEERFAKIVDQVCRSTCLYASC